ncbi:Lrp/AsnC ligand binding domain-containing protein [Aureispira anguillae]|uniref:Lrp/AsnC ligand binding domain-containing protein n=1 Tax=Aureispira anguillae TaxID=2864201 RepID=A0A915YIH8_9BACT|nr:Lrp/AsnC ligand binding domain-containing protein [Aureispira anguillae]BDS13591.1 Lrp/AsnC ligand binding domain-containing protein [Aureispira anguillae]
MNLDHIDKQILNILMQDATTTAVEVAKQVHVSPGTVHVRMKNLRQAGVVQGTMLKVDYSMLGLNMVAFVGIYLERSSQYTEVVLRLQQIPEIVMVHYTTGPYSIFAQIVCKDSQDLHEILQHHVQGIKGVQRTESFISLEESIHRPVDILKEEDLL